jgi:dihydrofolate reductase
MTPLTMIAAVSRNRAIGKDGKLPWSLPEDLKRFKAITTGHAVIMGRKTYESIGRPLPNRFNFVISRTWTAQAPCGLLSLDNLAIAPSLDDVLQALSGDHAFIIGGQQIYEAAMPFATRLLITDVDVDVEGADAFFPEIPGDFVEVERVKGETSGVSFVTYERRTL